MKERLDRCFHDRNFGNFEKLAMAGMLINTPRLSKDERSIDLIGKEEQYVCVCSSEEN